jgi:hypothetical protein
MREIKFRIWNEINNEWLPEHIVDKWPAVALNSNHPYVQQFTGLKDKNGKEIYEGDILALASVANGIVASVKYREASFLFGDSPLYQDRASCLEIIGNIYENPDLIQN